MARHRFVINKDGTNYPYDLADDPGFTGISWTTGKSWTHQIDGTNSASVITVTVVDLDKSDAIWTSQVVGGIKGNPPNILQRYIDSNPLTSTPDAVKENNTFSRFVKIEDVDGDLNQSNIYIDASGVAIPGFNGDERKDYINHGNGWYEWAFDKVWNATAIDGAVVVIYASDTKGHQVVSSYVIEITMLPSDTIEI